MGTRIPGGYAAWYSGMGNRAIAREGYQPVRTIVELDGNDWKVRLLFLPQLARDLFDDLGAHVGEHAVDDAGDLGIGIERTGDFFRLALCTSGDRHGSPI